MIKVLHIGLGKCGSTFLQSTIFPKVAKKLNIKYYGGKSYVELLQLLKLKEKSKLHTYENHTNIEKLFPTDFIISNENLFSKGWEFSRIELSFNYIKNNFSKDTVILIVIRSPYDFLNSIYAQEINDMRIYKPNQFFDLDESFINHLKTNNKKLINRSISKYGVNFILFLNKFFDVGKNQLFIKNSIKPSNNLIIKLKNKFLSNILLRNFFQYRFDKIVLYKKYYIPKKYLPIDIEKENVKYENI